VSVPRALEDSERPRRRSTSALGRTAASAFNDPDIKLLAEGAVMKELVSLVAATGLGTLVATGVVVLAAPTPQTCSGGADLARINKRFDDLDQAIADLQSQLAKAASDDALANANNERQLAAISSQVGVVSTTVAAISGRIR
jgi:hypothetical protein